MPTAKKAPAKKKVAVKRTVPALVIQTGPLGPTGRYHVRVEMNEHTFIGNTDDIKATILALRPDHFSTKVVLKFSLASAKDGKSVEFVYRIPTARRIFGNTTSAEILQKAVRLGLGDYHV